MSTKSLKSNGEWRKVCFGQRVPVRAEAQPEWNFGWQIQCPLSFSKQARPNKSWGHGRLGQTEWLWAPPPEQPSRNGHRWDHQAGPPGWGPHRNAPSTRTTLRLRLEERPQRGFLGFEMSPVCGSCGCCTPEFPFLPPAVLWRANLNDIVSPVGMAPYDHNQATDCVYCCSSLFQIQASCFFPYHMG